MMFLSILLLSILSVVLSLTNKEVTRTIDLTNSIIKVKYDVKIVNVKNDKV